MLSWIFNYKTRVCFPSHYYAITPCPNGHDCVFLVNLQEEILVHKYTTFRNVTRQCCCPDMKNAVTKIIPNAMKSSKQPNMIYCRL